MVPAATRVRGEPGSSAERTVEIASSAEPTAVNVAGTVTPISGVAGTSATATDSGQVAPTARRSRTSSTAASAGASATVATLKTGGRTVAGVLSRDAAITVHRRSLRTAGPPANSAAMVGESRIGVPMAPQGSVASTLESPAKGEGQLHKL